MSFSFDRRILAQLVEIVEVEAEIGKNFFHGNAAALVERVNAGLDGSRLFECDGLAVHWRQRQFAIEPRKLVFGP